MSWVKLNWDFGLPYVKYRIGMRQLMCTVQRGDALATKLVDAWKAQNPASIQQAAEELIQRSCPSLKGGSVVQIDGDRGYMMVCFYYVHKSLPPVLMGQECEVRELELN